MLHHLPSSMLNDPFHFPSSSPEKLSVRPCVATRPNPYTIKSQNTQYYTSLRTTAQAVPLDLRLSNTSTTPRQLTVLAQQSIDSLYTSLEAASRSPRCSSKPHTSIAKPFPLLTMVKAKARPSKALALNAELAAAKRVSCVEIASTAAGKRRRNAVEAAKQHNRSSSIATTGALNAQAQSTQSPDLSSPSSSSSPSSPSNSSPSQRAARPKKSGLPVPRITIRSPTPEPEASIDVVLQDAAKGDVNEEDKNAPLYSELLLKGLQADFSNAEDGIDSILSKFFDLSKSGRTTCAELLRYLASSICRLYSFVENPESDFGRAQLRAISSQLFRHTITGFFHLLDDPLAPYGTASSLALLSVKVLQDFDKATEWGCRVMSGSTMSRAQQCLGHGQLFCNVLHDELKKILDRGLAMTNAQNRLALPGKDVPMLELSIESDHGDIIDSLRPKESTWSKRAEIRKQWAQQGDERHRFVGIDVVRFIGELALHDIIDVPVLSKWIDRFLVHTAYPDMPSAWEVECACALLITVGPMLDRKPESTDLPVAQDSLSASGSGSQENTMMSVNKTVNAAGLSLLQRTMDRIEILVTQAEISSSAREWLTEVQQLRGRGWSREEDSDSWDGYLDSE